MRTSVLGSSIIHLIVIAALFIVRQSAPMVVPGPDVVQVALMDSPSEVTPPQPKAPEPKPEIEKPDVKPLDESGVKLDKPKPQPKPKKEQKQPEATPPPAMALPSAAVGSAGLSAEVAVDARNFEFTYYLILVRNKIASNWAPPSGLAGGAAAKAIVFFRIRRDGSVDGAQLETGSNFESFDRSALRAVLVSDPLPPLPLGFGGGDLGVHFGFQYQTP